MNRDRPGTPSKPPLKALKVDKQLGMLALSLEKRHQEEGVFNPFTCACTTYAHAHTYAHTHVRTQPYTHARTYTTRAHTYALAHAYAHTCVHVQLKGPKALA